MELAVSCEEEVNFLQDLIIHHCKSIERNKNITHTIAHFAHETNIHCEGTEWKI